MLSRCLSRFKTPFFQVLRQSQTVYLYSSVKLISTSQCLQKIKMSEEEWSKKLTDDQFYVAKQKGTEPPFTGKYYDHKEKGIYTCVCCGSELFSSITKYDSGSGWPSFYDTIKDNNNKSTGVTEHTDSSHGMVRTEVTCHQCDAHLGHVFPDGPKPTGLRYCINSASLNFKK